MDLLFRRYREIPSVDSLSRDELRAVDARAIERGIPGPVLMENAARGIVKVLLARGVSGPVAIVAGKGNNGGDGFAVARLLRERGVDVRVEVVCDPAELVGDAKIAFDPLESLGIPIQAGGPTPLERLRRCQWIIDAMLGTGAAGGVRAPFDRAIDAVNRAGRRLLAVDVPSGLDCETGRPLGERNQGPAVRAECTVTFVAPKRGFGAPGAREFTGDVHVAFIGACDLS